MNVILRSKVEGLGQRGDIVDVAQGYARNFLFPKGHAIKASAGALEQAAKMRASRDSKDQSAREAANGHRQHAGPEDDHRVGEGIARRQALRFDSRRRDR